MPAAPSGARETMAPGQAWSRLALAIDLGLLVGLLVLAAQMRLVNSDHFSGSFDEGIRAQQLLLMELGYRPFRDIFASQGPLLLDLLFPLYLAFGATLAAARLAVGALSLVGLIGVWWTGRALHPVAGLAAAIIACLSPTYLESSRLALAELPSMAPCLWAIGCGLRWQRGGRAGWIYAAALLATLGVLVKPMALPVAVPLAVLVLLRQDRRLKVVVGAACAAAALAGLVLLLLDPQRVFEVLGGYRLGIQRPAGSTVRPNLALISKVLEPDRLGLPLLALGGCVAGLLRWPRSVLALATWPLAQLGLFLLYTDLADKHIVYLVPPLALLGGMAVCGLAVFRHPRRLIRELRPNLTAWISLLPLLIYLISLPGLWRSDHELLRDADERARRDYAGTQEQSALMSALVGPTEFVLTDNPMAAYLARRPVPPWLVDTSGTRIDAGSLTSEVAIREANRYQPGVVVTLRRRLGKLEAFNRWLSAGYRFIKTYPGSDPSTPLQLFVRADLEDQARAFLAAR